MSDEATISTEDIDLTAYLLAAGSELASVTRADLSNRHRFVIRGERVRELSAVYVRGEAVIRLDAFLNARRGLLDRMHRAERVR